MLSQGRKVYIATIIFSLLFTLAGFHAFSGFQVETSTDVEFIRARVISVDAIVQGTDFLGNDYETIYFTARINEGDERGATVSGIQEVGGMFAISEKEIHQGNRIFIYFNENELMGDAGWRFAGYNRTLPLVVLCVSFLAAILLIGRMKGIGTVLSLTFTCAAIFLVYIPSILNGVNVYLSTIVVGVYIIVMSLLLINGANAKTWCAVLGNVGGVIIAALLALLMNRIMRMTGFFNEEMVFLSFTSSGDQLNILGIVWGGMVLGSLGAIMDVAMTIASSMHELSEHMNRKDFAKMFASGMNIGRDAIGTMTNTLILAYIGSSLALVMLLMVYTGNVFSLFSMEMIAAEIVQAITGSVGILFAVPLTAYFSAYIYSRADRDKGRDEPW